MEIWILDVSVQVLQHSLAFLSTQVLDLFGETLVDIESFSSCFGVGRYHGVVS